MISASKYGKIYAESEHALGDPFSEIVEYFEAKSPPLHVLDFGAGQGRDALMIARLGFEVYAVDLSPVGLQQLQAEALDAGVGDRVTTEIADFRDYVPPTKFQKKFDVILIDRSLHMIGVEAAIPVLSTLVSSLAPKGEVFIHDERKDVPAYADALQALGLEIFQQTKNYLIAKHG